MVLGHLAEREGEGGGVRREDGGGDEVEEEGGGGQTEKHLLCALSLYLLACEVDGKSFTRLVLRENIVLL